MISEQVKGLRKLGNQWKHNDVAGYHLILDACDTIEALSAKLAAHNLDKGEWIDKGNWMGIECSRCKCHSRYVTPFCPQCGAKMTKGGDE